MRPLRLRVHEVLAMVLAVLVCGLAAPQLSHTEPLDLVSLRTPRTDWQAWELPEIPQPAPRVIKPESPHKPVEAPSSPAIPTGSVQARIVAVWAGDDSWVLRTVRCESRFNPRAVSRTGKYRGLFQADRHFWAGFGGTGDPIDASVEEQTLVAWRGFQARGSSPWPHCGR